MKLKEHKSYSLNIDVSWQFFSAPMTYNSVAFNCHTQVRILSEWGRPLCLAAGKLPGGRMPEGCSIDVFK